MTQTIQLTQRDNGVAILTLNRPDALNSLNLEAMQGFASAVESLSQAPHLRAVILTGAGERAFCSGGDLVELRPRTSQADARHFTGIMVEALAQLEQLPVPVIAAINGYALGGGSEIALACDLRIVDERVKMGFVQINMAVTPGWGAGQRLLHLVGYSNALELLLKGDILRADDLLALGLANQKVGTGLARTAALTLANRIAARPPRVVQGIKALLQAGRQHSEAQARQIEFDIFPPLWADEAHLNAVETFFQKQARKQSRD